MITCDQILEALGDLLENEAAADLRREMEAHLSGCGTCEVILDTLRRTMRIVADSRSFDLPEEVSERLLERVMARVRSSDKAPGPGGSSRPPLG